MHLDHWVGDLLVCIACVTQVVKALGFAYHFFFPVAALGIAATNPLQSLHAGCTMSKQHKNAKCWNVRCSDHWT